jgi:hypothetical protein
MTIPDIDVITAAALIAAIGDSAHQIHNEAEYG